MLGQKIVDIDRFARNSLTPKPIASVRVKISSSVVDLAETAGPSSFGTSTSRITRSTSCSQLVTSAETPTADRCGFISKHDWRSHWHGALGGRGRTLGAESARLLKAAVEWFNGKDLGDRVYAFLRDTIAPSENVQTAGNGNSTEASPSKPPSRRATRARAGRLSPKDLAVYQAAEAETSYAAAAASPPSSSRRLHVSAQNLQGSHFSIAHPSCLRIQRSSFGALSQP